MGLRIERLVYSRHNSYQILRIRTDVCNKIFFALITTLLCVAGCGTDRPTSASEEIPMTVNSIQQTGQELLNGAVEALCYSGFRSGQYPDRGEGANNPSEAEILEDLRLLKDDMNTTLIRMYDSGENTATTLRLIREHQLDIKVLLGIWLNAELSNHETCPWLIEPIPDSTLAANRQINKAEIDRGIALAKAYSDIVVAVNVGNEALVDWNDHKVATDTVIGYVRRVQQSIEQPVTVADNYLWWAEQGAALAEAVDFISIHVYPIWEGKTIDEAMSYTRANVQQVRDALPNSTIVIAEAGWATIASEFGGQASEENQLRYYRELMRWATAMNITTFFFEAFDEDWKGDPNDMNGAEKHWGMYNVDRTPKWVVSEQTTVAP